MIDWRLLLFSAVAFLGLLAGFFVLSLPSPYEGQILYTLDAGHSVQLLDGVGLALMVVGGLAAWGAGWVWWRQNRR